MGKAKKNVWVVGAVVLITGIAIVACPDRAGEFLRMAFAVLGF